LFRVNECKRLIASVDNFLCKQVRHGWKIATLLLQLRVLRLGFFQGRDVGVGVFPQREELLVSSYRFDPVAGEHICAAKLQAGQRAPRKIERSGKEFAPVGPKDMPFVSLSWLILQ
jgi:hypothetical protein